MTPKPVVSLAPKGWFNIVGKTGLCVSARNNNGKLTQQTCGTGNDLLWTAQNFKNGLIIKNKTGRVMDNAGQRPNNGNPTLGYAYNGTPAQIWVIESVRNGDHVHFRNLQRNKCFDDTGRAAINRTYHIWDCSNGNRNQWFRLITPKPVVTVQIPSGQAFNFVGPNGFCVTAPSKNAQRLTQQSCANTPLQLWTFIPHNGAYVIKNNSGLVIDNSGSRNKNGNSIIGYTQHNKFNQQWVPIKVDANHFLLQNPKTGKCLDNTGKPGANGLYHLWDCSKTNKNQLFNIAHPKPVAPVVPVAPVAPVEPVAPVTPVTPTVVPEFDISNLGPIPYFTPFKGKLDIDTLRN
jgi:hypothetical protein